MRDGDIRIRALVANLDALASISIVTMVELESGVWAVPSLTAVRRERTHALLARLPILELDGQIVTAYGNIVSASGYSRTKLLDRLIAATAVVHDLTLITMNAVDFRDVPGLKLVSWPAPAQ